MVAIELLRFVYFIYFIVLALILYNALSGLLFGDEDSLKVRVKKLGRKLLVAPVWPLLFLSSGGFAKLRQLISIF